jgi:two-component system, NarL family, nitrate/nitrite response regulator NarL
MRIVIADDHMMLREMLCETLNSAFGAGTVVGQVPDYPSLFALAGDKPAPDLLLIDLHMPGASAHSGIKEALKLFPGVKILVISGLADPATARHVLDLGASGFIPKTVSNKSLVNAVRVITDGERYVHAFTLSDGGSASEATASSSNLPHFSDREEEILKCLLDGNSNKEIARRLDIQEMTIKTHLRNIYRKLGAQNRADAVSRVLRSRN